MIPRNGERCSKKMRERYGKSLRIYTKSWVKWDREHAWMDFSQGKEKPTGKAGLRELLVYNNEFQQPTARKQKMNEVLRTWRTRSSCSQIRRRAV